jgi:hypothetical protein
MGRSLLAIGVALLLALAALGAAPRPSIERGAFVDFGYSSPWWYPPTEETDSYRWAPRLHWPVPSIQVAINPTDSGFAEGELDDVVEQVSRGLEAWDAASDSFSVVAKRDDSAQPSLVYPDGKLTVSWGQIDGPGGAVAITYYWYYRNTKELVDADVIFDIAEGWSLSGEPSKYDVWNTAAHEGGHLLVLQDLRSPRDGALTMHAFTWPGDTLKRDLGLGDILGVQAIYGE